jgi:hypothetical protein
LQCCKPARYLGAFLALQDHELALSKQALGQFDDCELPPAAELLAHAKAHAITWNNTSPSWFDFHRAERLAARVTLLPAASLIRDGNRINC